MNNRWVMGKQLAGWLIFSTSEQCPVLFILNPQSIP